MTLEFEQAVKALDEQIEVLKQDLFFCPGVDKTQTSTHGSQNLRSQARTG
jgi:hypothetical protein